MWKVTYVNGTSILCYTPTQSCHICVTQHLIDLGDSVNICTTCGNANCLKVLSVDIVLNISKYANLHILCQYVVLNTHQMK